MATKTLKAYILTFNLARCPPNPSTFAAHLFDTLPLPPPTTRIAPPEILILSLQEIAPIAYAFLGGSYLESYLEPLRRAVDIAAAALAPAAEGEGGYEYVNVVTRNVGMTAIMVFVRRDQVGKIRGVEMGGVGVGRWGMGNKGAVGVRLRWDINGGDDGDGDAATGRMEVVEVVAVAAHLAPMEEGVGRRNEDWGAVVRGLVFEAVDGWGTTRGTTSTQQRRLNEEEGDDDLETERLLSSTPDHTDSTTSTMTGIYTPTSHLLLAGDLNYRTSPAPPLAEEHRSFPQPCADDSYPQHYSHLFQSDQLTVEMRAGRTCQGLREVEEVDFPPTYKYSERAKRDAEGERGNMDAEGRRWEWAKNRWPSWCDRVLYLPMPSWATMTTEEGGKKEKEKVDVEVKGYAALPLMPSSDHRPVACYLEIPAVAIPAPAPEQRDGDAHTSGKEAAAADQVRLQPPFPLDPSWKTRRTWARRREVVVGLGAYLALTWEGRGMLLALMCGVLGAWAIVGSQ